MDQTLSKAERVCGRGDISTLLSKGSWDSAGALKYCWLSPGGAACSRIMVSVPKKVFRRAVKRNRIKRLVRESYRTQKDLLCVPASTDILFVYTAKEIRPFEDIRADVAKALKGISAKVNR